MREVDRKKGWVEIRDFLNSWWGGVWPAAPSPPPPGSGAPDILKTLLVFLVGPILPSNEAYLC